MTNLDPTLPENPLVTGALSYLPNYINKELIKSTTVVAPDNSRTIHYFNRNVDSTYYDKEVARQYYSTAVSPTLLRQTVTTYSDVIDGDGVSAIRIGTAYIFNESQKSMAYIPVIANQVTTNYLTDGNDVFTTTYLDYNAHGIATKFSEQYGENVKYTL